MSSISAPSMSHSITVVASAISFQNLVCASLPNLMGSRTPLWAAKDAHLWRASLSWSKAKISRWDSEELSYPLADLTLIAPE